MIAIDTNVLVRLLLNDDVRQSERAYALMVAHDRIAISQTALCETYWVLTRSARIRRMDAVEAIVAALDTFSLEHDADAVQAGVSMAIAGGDFADGVIAHQAREAGAATLYTFDKGFARKADPAICRVALLEG